MRCPCLECDEHQRHITEEKRVAGGGKVAGKNEPGCRNCDDRIRYANQNLGLPLDHAGVPLSIALNQAIGYENILSEQHYIDLGFFSSGTENR